MRTLVLCIALLVACVCADADQPAKEVPAKKVTKTTVPKDSAKIAKDGTKTAKDGTKTLSGMSILGNREAPKSLVIVPWKSSEIGKGIDLSALLDDRAVPVDKDVFMRKLKYYEIQSQRKTH